MFSQKHLSLKGLLIVTGGLLTAGVAYAATTSNSPGSACVATTGSLTVRADGEAENQSASTVTAICPTERPVGGDTTTTTLSGKVFVVDRSTTANVCCRAVSKNPSAAKNPGAWECSSGSTSAYQTLDLAPVTDAATFSSFFLECQVPPVSGGNASRIQTYRTVQQ